MTQFITHKKGIVAGVDLGGTNTEIGLIDSDGKCHERSVLDTKSFAQPEAFAEAVIHEIEQMAAGKLTSLKGIGIGAPNGNYYTGCIEHAPNLEWKGILPVAAMMSSQIKLPVALTNDANAAAMGEMTFGKAQGMKDFISITLGTGLGSGIVVNGAVLYGKTGFAGEMGHTTIVPGGRPCTCGKKGCLEAYVSARGLVQTALEIAPQFEEGSLISNIAPAQLTPYQIHLAATRGDLHALASYAEMGMHLGRAIANVAALFSPEAFFLFGGLSHAFEHFLKPTQEAFDQEILPILRGSIKLELSALNEDNAAILGAGALIWNKILEQ